MNKESLQDHLEEVKKRIKNGALPENLLKEYVTKLELSEAFFIITQAQIQIKEEAKHR
tara:strand:+ start:449 stop:622 length:174 start_codon:yes stop_codon:yes gene_type:complete